MNPNKNYVIAIDGFSSTGKSTIAKELAKKLNFIHIDTGAMYRAVTLYLLQNNIIEPHEILDDKLIAKYLDEITIGFQYNSAENTNEVLLNGKNVESEIRSLSVSNMVSPVAELSCVRSFLVAQQQSLGKTQSVVMDGRDIGTTVFPHADVKLFITCQPEIRAERRYQELLNKGQNITLEEVTRNVVERDKIDTTREISPLRKAEDAIEIDNSYLNQKETFDKVLATVKEKTGL